MFTNGFGGFNFFPGSGGGNFEDEGGQPEEEQAPKEKDNKLYEIIGVEVNASTDDIRKNYKKKALKIHPDKGGDPEKFKELTHAYEILSNPEKRDLYDRGGIEAVNNGGMPGAGGFDDILGGLFGFGGGRGRKDNKPKKAKPILKELKVTLEDVYLGKMIEVPISRKRICEECNGKGGENVTTCSACKGKGMVERMIMLGPGMYQHSSQPCKDCKGEGKSVPEKDKCKKCKGNKVIDEKKNLEVAIESGVPHEHDYIFTGENDEYPGIMGGDVYVRIIIEPHKVFTRRGADLYVEKKISLLEALTGFTMEIKQLDGTILKIATAPGDVISHEQIKTVKRKGMPFYKDAMSHGNMYVKFLVQFPKKGELKDNQIKELQKILPGPKVGPAGKKENVEFLEDFEETEMNPNPEGGKHREEDYEDMPGRGQGQRVQCNQQ